MIEAQCGGEGNVARFYAVASALAAAEPFSDHLAGFSPTYFAGPEETTRRLFPPRERRWPMKPFATSCIVPVDARPIRASTVFDDLAHRVLKTAALLRQQRSEGHIVLTMLNFRLSWHADHFRSIQPWYRVGLRRQRLAM